MTKIAKIYKHNYISLKWLIHEVKMDMCRERFNLNFLEIAILNGILHVLTLKATSST